MADESKHTPDQPKVRGADVIYRPAGEAGEYAALATNPYTGCGHKCAYCYVPNAMHLKRPTFDAGAVPRPGYDARLRKDVVRYACDGISNGHPADQVFITFSSDPWHPGDVEPTVRAIETLIMGGMSFCTLSKGGMKAWSYRGYYRPKRDAYAATLTTLDDDFSRKWERAAPLPADRIEALRKFHDAGVFTWVSLEPTLDVEASIAIVRATHDFVDLYKVGRANYVPTITKVVDWRSYTLRMIEELSRVGAKHYIKRDLQPHLPEGYDNQLRVPQHR